MTNPFGAVITPITPEPTPAVTAGQVAQIYCTVDELLLDPAPPAGGVELLYKEILAASQTIQHGIGEFIPVLETRKFQGGGGKSLVIPPLLGLSGSIVNDGVTLPAADFIYCPDGRHWRNGPWSWLEVAANPTVLRSWSREREGVEIPGRWGKYEETADTETTLAVQQSESTTVLQTGNGARISPGLVALIGSEQLLVSGYDTPVAGVTALADDIDEVQESFDVDDGSLVNIGEVIRAGVEQMRILDINGDALYVQRHWNKTTGAAHKKDDDVDVYRKFVVARAVNGTTAAAHAASAGISRYVAPANINYLCKQIATLMLQKAAGGYAGKTGNADTGQVYYYDEVPRFFFERLKKEYAIQGA